MKIRSKYRIFDAKKPRFGGARTLGEFCEVGLELDKTVDDCCRPSVSHVGRTDAVYIGLVVEVAQLD